MEPFRTNFLLAAVRITADAAPENCTPAFGRGFDSIVSEHVYKSFIMLIDISLPITPDLITYPGNPEVALEVITSPVSHSQLTRLILGTHTGTHVDAPVHVVPGGRGMSVYDLAAFVGSCRVLDATGCESAVTEAFLYTQDIVAGERILLKTTNSIRGFEKLHDDFIFLNSAAATYLANLDIALIGIDYLSIKQRGLPDNTAHTAFLDRPTPIPIIEGLNLSAAEPGEYTLLCLPLSLPNADAAPARVVLMKD